MLSAGLLALVMSPFVYTNSLVHADAFAMIRKRKMNIFPIKLKRKGFLTTNSLLPFMASDQKKCNCTIKEMVMMRVTLEMQVQSQERSQSWMQLKSNSAMQQEHNRD